MGAHAPENSDGDETVAEVERDAEIGATPGSDDEIWITPPFQPVRAIGTLLLTACGFGLYEYVLVSFWSVPWMGIHDRIPWPAYAILAAALIIVIAAVRVAFAMRSPHAKLGFGLLAFMACVVVGVGGGRFVSYTMRGTLNPPFQLKIAVGDKFPPYSLTDQNGAIRNGPQSGAAATLIFIYRGDYCPFARYELADLTKHAKEFRDAGIDLVAISADPVARSKMLAGYLGTSIPLLSDEHESILGTLGLVQRHRNGEPDNAIPAFIVVDRKGTVRWILTSPYYRELPTTRKLLDAAKSVVSANPAPTASPS
jgi:peroxiredoxin